LILLQHEGSISLKQQDDLLVRAAEGGRLDVVKFLQTINWYDKIFQLCIAIVQEDREMIELWLNRQTNINGKLSNGIMPLHMAYLFKDYHLASYLIKRGANWSVAFKVAIELGHRSLASLMFGHGKLDFYLIYYAVEHGQLECVKEFAYSCDVEKPEKNGMTPLMLAVIKDNDQIVKYLIENCSVDPHVKLTQNVKETNLTKSDNAFIAAIKYGCIKVLNYFFAADPNKIIDLKHNDMTPLHHAVLAGELTSVKRLIQLGAEINCQTKTGATPLLLAVERGHLNIVKYLLKKGAKTDIQLKQNGDTALHIARRRGLADIADKLIQYAADQSILNQAKERAGDIKRSSTKSSSILSFFGSFARIEKADKNDKNNIEKRRAFFTAKMF
jgi:ankyrin repeat protein